MMLGLIETRNRRWRDYVEALALGISIGVSIIGGTLLLGALL